MMHRLLNLFQDQNYSFFPCLELAKMINSKVSIQQYNGKRCYKYNVLFIMVPGAGIEPAQS